jgi:hypothetical protein
LSEVESPETSFEAAIAAVHAEAAKRQAPATQEPADTGSQSGAGSQASAEPVPAAPAGNASAQPVGTPAAAPQAASDESKPPEGAPVDPALKRLLDREAKLQEREKEISALEGAKRRIKYDPVAAIKAIAPDVSLSEIAKALWVEELGDLAPPEAKQQREVRGVRSEVEDLRAQVAEERRLLAEERARQEGELAMNQYTGAIKSTVDTVDAGKYPLVKSFHKKHSDGVVDELLAIARNHAQSTGEILPPGALLERLEGYLGRYQVQDVAPAPAVSPVETPQVAANPSTLRNQHTQAQPGLQPVDELSDEYLRAQAMKAVREDRKRRGIG